MRTVTRILSTTLAGAALAGVACIAGSGAAHGAETRTVVAPAGPQTAPDGEMRAESTRRFTISNLSEKRLRVQSVVSTWANDPTPAAGTVIAPGGSLPVEVTWWFGYDQNVTVVLDVLRADGSVAGRTDVTLRLGNWAQPSSFGFSGADLKVQADGYDVAVVDQASTIVVPADQPERQSELITWLVDSGRATATFQQHGARDDNAWSAPYIVGNDVLTNLSAEPATKTITRTTSQSESTSLGVSASVKVAFGSLVEASLTTSFGREWTSTEGFAASATVTARPGEAAWVEARNPVQRVRGDLHVTLGATTWILEGVSFDTPDPNPSRAALTVPRSRPMTAAEIDELGPGLHMVSADVLTGTQSSG